MCSSVRADSAVSARVRPESIRVSSNRSRRLLIKSQCLLVVIFLYACLVGHTTAQVRFVQLTDPHLFDKSEEEMSQNRQILIDAVAKINELDVTNKYAFVVVTGDIGIEQIAKSASDVDPSRIDQDAKAMASILVSSKVKVWLFVPGNNDLINEMDDTIDHYHQFMQTLHNELEPYQIEVVDLCAKGAPKPHLVGVKKEYAFIGFNDASFKNNNEALRLGGTVEKCCDQPDKCSYAGKIRCTQESEIRRVSSLLTSDIRFAYIFYHIPEVNDPYLLRNDLDWPDDTKLRDFHGQRLMKVDVTGAEYMDSSWFIDRDLRSSWARITKADRVKGLFAGHLHEQRPELYLSYQGNNDHPKLYLCPPLAVKRQSTDKPQARGFQTVSIDEGRNPSLLKGEISTSIYWYNPASRLFSVNTPQLIVSLSPQLTRNGEPMFWETAAHMSTVFQFLVVAASLYLIWKQLNKQEEQLRKQEKQLKQQTDLARFANTQALVALASPFTLEMAKNIEMAELWAITAEQWENLYDGKKQQHKSMIIWWLVFYENIFFQAERELLDKDIYVGWKKDIDAFVDEQLVEKHWSSVRTKYHDKFVVYIDELIKKKENRS